MQNQCSTGNEAIKKNSQIGKWSQKWEQKFGERRRIPRTEKTQMGNSVKTINFIKQYRKNVKF